MSYVDFLVCKRCFRCWLCDFLFSRQNGAERKQRPIFTFFPPPFSSHSARHRLLLLGYPLSGKSTRQLSTYKRKNYWIYKLSIYFSNARFHMFFGFRPASGRESVSLVCPHCRLWLPAHSMLRSPNCPFVLFVGTKKLVKRREFEEYISQKLVIWRQKIIYKNSLREKNLSAIIMSLQWALFSLRERVYNGQKLKRQRMR